MYVRDRWLLYFILLFFPAENYQFHQRHGLGSSPTEPSQNFYGVQNSWADWKPLYHEKAENKTENNIENQTENKFENKIESKLLLCWMLVLV